MTAAASSVIKADAIVVLQGVWHFTHAHLIQRECMCQQCGSIIHASTESSMPSWSFAGDEEAPGEQPEDLPGDKADAEPPGRKAGGSKKRKEAKREAKAEEAAAKHDADNALKGAENNQRKGKKKAMKPA